MSNAIETQGTKLEIATGSGVAKNISAISLGAITEVTSTAHGLAVGDVVTFASIVGTTGLNGLSGVVIAKETDTFFVNIDSSAMDAYVSGGTATPSTFTEVGEIVDFDGPGGSASVIDVSHLGSTRKEKRMGLPDEGQFTFNLNFVPVDVGQAAVRTARANRTQKNFRVTYSDDSTDVFDGYVLNFSKAGGVDAKVSGSVTIEITGEVTFTAA